MSHIPEIVDDEVAKRLNIDLDRDLLKAPVLLEKSEDVLEQLRRRSVITVLLVMFTIYLNKATYQNGRLDFFFYLAVLAGVTTVYTYETEYLFSDLDKSLNEVDSIDFMLSALRKNANPKFQSTIEMGERILVQVKELMNKRAKYEKWFEYVRTLTLILVLASILHATIGFGRFIHRWSSTVGGVIAQNMPRL